MHHSALKCSAKGDMIILDAYDCIFAENNKEKECGLFHFPRQMGEMGKADFTKCLYSATIHKQNAFNIYIV